VSSERTNRRPGAPPRAPGTSSGGSADGVTSWTFLTNHAHVLLSIAAQPEPTLREVAARVGITERAVQRIVADLETAGYLRRDRTGRRNSYQIDPDLPLRHPVERHQAVNMLLALVRPAAPTGKPGRRAAATRRRDSKPHGHPR